MRTTRLSEIVVSVFIAAFLQLNAAVAEQVFQEEFHKTYPLDKAGRVSLENVNGSVHVVSWDRDEISIDAVKHADKQEHLDGVKIEVNAKPDRVDIKTKYPDSKLRNNKSNSTTVDYTLKVPKQSRLDKVNTVNGALNIQNVEGEVIASTVNGPVTATGLAGEVHLTSVNGPVNVTLTEIGKAISLESVNGKVDLALPAQANAEVSASTVNGNTSSDFPLPAQKHSPGWQNLHTKLGEGGPHIKISSVNGPIRINRTKAVALENP